MGNVKIKGKTYALAEKDEALVVAIMELVRILQEKGK